MAAGPGGIGQLIMSALQGRTASGGGAPGGMPGMPGGGGDPGGGDQGAQYAQQVAQLKGADPGMLLQEMKQMKQKCAVLMVQNLERLPNVSGTLSKLIPQFDRVIKEIQQAQNVNSAVRSPIGMGAAQPPMDSPQATAAPGGM
jgi:hypothetical protein